MQQSKTYRIPGLDGLRAIAILLIVLGHLWQQDFWSGTCPLSPLPIPGGALSIFFVLSGFLAGYCSDVTSDAKSYYIKRARKLFPAYYAYIFLVLIVYVLLGKLHEVLNPKLLYYIVPAGIVPFCTPAGGILPLVHLWFLTPIVMAYLAFPFVLNCKWGGQKTPICISATLCVAFAFLKWALYLSVGKETFAYRFFGASQFDCIFGGLFLGLVLKNDELELPKVLTHKTTSWILWILFITSGFFQEFIPAPVRNEFFGLLAAGLIISLISESAPFRFKATFWRKLSGASYKIYVYHILAIILLSELVSMVFR